MAEVCGVTQGQFSRVESGRALPSKELAAVMSRKSGGRVPVAVWGKLTARRGRQAAQAA
jgi:hypothetical protein